MLTIFGWSSSDEEDNELRKNVQIRYKYLRENSNPLELPNHLFLRSFRLDKETFSNLLSDINLFGGKNASYVPPILQLAIALNFLGGGGYQHQVGRDFNAPVSQGKASIIIGHVIQKMEIFLCPRKINFSLLESTKNYFLNKYDIPGVVGCIDGTHIMILRPHVNEHLFFNRKGRHSINCMIICDENYKILAVNPKFGGCSHDSFVWKLSNERIKMERFWNNASQTGTNPSYWLLGDSGYPLEPWLMTPYRSPQEGSPQSKYNTVHAKARSTVERAIGILKVRWRCIMEERKLRYTPRKITSIINVCAALHNLCVERKVPLPEDVDVIINNENEDSPIGESGGFSESESSEARNRLLAQQIRDNIMQSLNT